MFIFYKFRHHLGVLEVKQKPLISRLILFSQLFLWLLTSCGGIGVGTGGGGSPNDVRPSGSPIKQGQLLGGTGVSGAAMIFFSSGSSYILRFEGLNVPSGSNMVIQIFSTTFGQVGQLTLRDTTGNQNYSFTTSQQGVTFQSVAIYSTSSQSTIGTAVLQ